MLDYEKHPCYNVDAKAKFGRIHLPVAPKCNIQCNFCNRKYDCVNESRPGVSSHVLSPQQALAYLKDMKKRDARLAVAGIAGPGDPFANPDETMQTLRLIRQEFPDMLICVATNGLNAADHIPEMADLGVSHVTVTVNAVDPEIAEQIYAWVRDGKRVLRGQKAAQYLLEKQCEVIRLCKTYGMIVKINAILIPGMNDEHIGTIAETMARLGADLFNCIGMCRAEGAVFEDLQEPDTGVVCAAREQAQKYLPQMTHCTRCRADAVGCLSEALPIKAVQLMSHYAGGPLDPNEDRPYVAAATMEGFLVNVHLGQARQFNIYAYDEDRGPRLVDTRPAAAPGGGDERWNKLSEILHDCRALLVAQAGPKPANIMAQNGLKLICTESLIDQAVSDIFHKRTVPPPSRPRICGSSCGGNQSGCA